MSGYRTTENPAVTPRYEIFPDRRLLFLRYFGETRVTDMMEVAHKIWGDPRYDPTFDGIVDFREAKFVSSPEEISAISQYFLNAAEASRGRAAIIASAPMETALNLFFAKLMRGRNHLQIFSTWRAACAFVGADLRDPLEERC